MDPVSSVGRALSVVQWVTQRSLNYRRKRFGPICGDTLYFFGIVDTEKLREAHLNINYWTNEEALAWKKSSLTSLTAISVAGAIFASVGITSLQLPNLDRVHWIVRALLSSSMALGIMSTITATSLQRQIAYLNSATDIRLWLSSGRSEYEGKAPAELRTSSLPPLASSVSALNTSEAPHAFLRYALVLFLTGFGLYLLFSWTDNIEGNTDWRNTSIIFVCVVGLACLQTGTLKLWRAYDTRNREVQLDLKRSQATRKPGVQRSLHMIQEEDTKVRLKDLRQEIEVLTSSGVENEEWCFDAA